ncbi:hypothetical protein SAMN05892877_10735 [Rhizobium subbaraonis]|uniref:TolB-like protein n=1 Tax=Rhizobium subbaraonis TaxID=908946 RepID=A0A285UE02_9HYPH|nr:hypothetical protein [Rhizobium subbaraonis]SOC40164.1 hypothetical protein SAMN05892877_10735 [Rhizobium subbaraonis]
MDGDRALPPPLVRACVDDILASKSFSRSGRLRAFLSYVVECELAGKAAQLKGYTIGVDVFGRPEGFDAGSDPIVRVQAGKLRKLLDQYYEIEGADAPLRIRVPVGSYAPEYEWRHTEVQDATAVHNPSTTALPSGSFSVTGMPPKAREERRTPAYRCWKPAPISSHLALLTLLPLLVMAPVSYSELSANSIENVRVYVENARAELDKSTELPSIRIERCWPGTDACRQLADAIERAARYYKTVRLVERRAEGEETPLAYRIRIETTRDGGEIYARLVHEQSNVTVYAGHFPAGRLDDSASAYHAFRFATRALSTNGRLYSHARSSGLSSSRMLCLQAAEAGRNACLREHQKAAAGVRSQPGLVDEDVRADRAAR